MTTALVMWPPLACVTENVRSLSIIILSGCTVITKRPHRNSGGTAFPGMRQSVGSNRSNVSLEGPRSALRQAKRVPELGVQIGTEHSMDHLELLTLHKTHPGLA